MKIGFLNGSDKLQYKFMLECNVGKGLVDM